MFYRVSLPSGSVVKNPSTKEEVGSIPGSGRSPGEGNGNSLQYSYQENPMDRGAWQAAVHEVQRVRYNLTTENELIGHHIGITLYISPSF